MTRKSVPESFGESAFLAGLEENNDHIVDQLIKERCPSFVSHWSWPLIRPVLYSMLGYRKACELADKVSSVDGRQAFDWMTAEIDPQVQSLGLQNVPTLGRVIITANHPTGLADGIAMWKTLKEVRNDICFLANADAIRVSRTLEDVIIPVEWLKSKRSLAKTKETFRRVKEAMAQEKCLVIFPSGVPERVVNPGKGEQPWYPGFLNLARNNKAPIIPARMWGKNSTLYKMAASLSDQLRDITLFHELINKSGAELMIRFTEAIPVVEVANRDTLKAESLMDYTLAIPEDQPQTVSYVQRENEC